MNTEQKIKYAEIVIAAAGEGGLGKDGKRVSGYGAHITLFSDLDEVVATLHACARTGLQATAYRSCIEGFIATVRVVRLRFGAIPVSVITNLSAPVAAVIADKRKEDAADHDLLADLAALVGETDAATTFSTRNNAGEPRLIEAKAIVETVHKRPAEHGVLVREVSAWRRFEAAA